MFQQKIFKLLAELPNLLNSRLCNFLNTLHCNLEYLNGNNFIKFTARSNGFFKEDTEVLFGDLNVEGRRMTVIEYQSILNSPCQEEWFIGIRSCEDNWAFSVPGEERVDAEWCSLDEFDIDYVRDDISFSQWQLDLQNNYETGRIPKV
jgi:hypothetical protein